MLKKKLETATYKPQALNLKAHAEFKVEAGSFSIGPHLDCFEKVSRHDAPRGGRDADGSAFPGTANDLGFRKASDPNRLTPLSALAP